MASFYGAGVIVGGGGVGGTTDYDKLSNSPILNLTGLLPIDFSTLDFGVYNVKGNFKFSADGETHTWLNPNIIQVSEDTVTGQKIVHFDVYEDGKRFTQSVYYKPDGTYELEKYAYDAVESVDSDELPATGDESKIYSTEDGVYVYSEGSGYQKLGAPSQWELL